MSPKRCFSFVHISCIASAQGRQHHPQAAAGSEWDSCLAPDPIGFRGNGLGQKARSRTMVRLHYVRAFLSKSVIFHGQKWVDFA